VAERERPVCIRRKAWGEYQLQGRYRDGAAMEGNKCLLKVRRKARGVPIGWVLSQAR